MRKLLATSFLFFYSHQFFAQSECNCTLFSEKQQEVAHAQLLINSSLAGCRIKGYEIMARIFFIRKELDSAAYYLDKSHALLEKNNCSPQSFLSTYKYQANLYNNRADYEKQLEVELKINSILEKVKDTAGIANSFLSISDVFNRMKQADRGILYCRKAIPYINQLVSSSQKASLFTKAASRYFFYYEQYKDHQYLDTMESYTNQALAIMETTRIDRKLRFLIYTRLATVAIEKKEYSRALQYIDSNLRVCERDKDVPELAVNFSDKAEVYFRLGDYTSARQWADSSMAYTKLTQSPTHIANGYRLIYKIAEKEGDAAGALNAYKNEKIITDSIENADKVRVINEMEKKYNQARNEKRIDELAQQKKIYLLLAVAGLLGIISVIFFIRQLSLKHKKRIVETEQRLNRARMNPHFFFNALSALQHAAVSDTNGEQIAAKLSRFSHIMRKTLESTYEDYVTIEQEIEFLQEYLDVQQMRFPDKFNYNVTADKELAVDEIQLPAMLIQPFIENSIEHGFAGIDYRAELDIHFSMSEKDLRVTISDNGKGLPAAIAGNTEHISRASQIIKDRIYLLNIRLKAKASFNIVANPAGKGVLATIYLPLIYINHS